MIEIDITGPDLDNITRSSKMASVSGIDKMNRNLSNILKTPVGTRLYSPLFGSKLYMLRYEPITEILLDLIKIYVLEALTTSEPRIKVIDINVAKSKDSSKPNYKNTIIITITYQINNTSMVGQLVENFISEGGTGNGN